MIFIFFHHFILCLCNIFKVIFTNKKNFRKDDHPNLKRKEMKLHSGSKSAQKRRKPVFTDGRKLDNSVDWETIKIAKPPPEDLSDLAVVKTTTVANNILTTTNKFDKDTNDQIENMKSKTIKKLEIIRKELDGLQQDIEQTEAIKGS